MLRYLISMLLVSLLAVSGYGAERRALIVGVEEENPKFTKLIYAEDDAVGLANVLSSQPEPYSDVVLMTVARGGGDHPTAKNVRIKLKSLVDKSRTGDVLVVAFALHGFTVKDKIYLCPAGADVDKADTLIPLDDVYAELARCSASLKLLVVDACRTSMPARGVTLTPKKESEFDTKVAQSGVPKGVMVMFGCSPGERSWESDKLGHGVFMHYLITGLAGDETDKPEIEVGALFDYIFKKVPGETGFERKQMPHMVGNLEAAPFVRKLPFDLAIIQEDFANVRAGQLPAKWKSTGGVAAVVMRGVVQNVEAGKSSIIGPQFDLDGDFTIKLSCELYWWRTNNWAGMRLKGKGGTDMVIGAGGEARGGLGFCQFGQKTKEVQIDLNQRACELKLVRKGDNFQFFLNDKLQYATEVKRCNGFNGFEINLNRERYSRDTHAELRSVEIISHRGK